MASLTKMISLYLLIKIFVSSCFCKIEFGPFGIILVDDTTTTQALQPRHFSSAIPSILLTSSLSTVTDTSPNDGMSKSWVTQYFVPIFSMVSILSTSFYFVTSLCKLIRMHWKYRHFTFRRKQNNQSRNLIQMDVVEDVYHDAVSFV